MESTNLWEAWKLAKTYHCRPSELYGIRDEVAALFFDRAVYLLGSEIDSDLAVAGDGAKNKKQAIARQQRVLDKWLGNAKAQQYKDPAAAAGGIIKSVPGTTVTL